METGLLNSYGHHARFKRMNIGTAPGYSEESEAATTSPESVSRKGSSREGSVDGWRVRGWRNCGGRLDGSAASNDDKVNTKISNYEMSSHSHADIEEEQEPEEEEEETYEEQDLDQTPSENDTPVEVVDNYEEDDQSSSYDDDIIRNHINYLNSLPADSDFGECHASAENDTTHHPDSCCLPPVIHIFAVDPELDLYYSSDDSDNCDIPEQMSGVDYKIDNESKDSSSESESESDDGEDSSESSSEYEDEGVETQESLEVVNADVPRPEESSDDSDAGIEEMCDKKFKKKEEIVLKKIPKIEKESIKVNTGSPAPVECNDPPQLGDLKKFIFEEIVNVKATDHARSANVNRSLSLPHSPSHEMFAPLDNPEVKMSLSMEDLNFLWNFGDDQGIGKVLEDDSEIKTLTDMEVNAFLNYDSNKNCKGRADEFTENSTLLDPAKTGDNLCEEDMEIDCPVLAHIDYVNDDVKSTTVSNMNKASKSSADVSLLGFCIEKPKKEITNVKIPKFTAGKIEIEDFVDVESFCDNTSMPVLQANNVVSLLEQFEATEELNKYDLKSGAESVESVPNVELHSGSSVNGTNPIGKVNGLVNGTRIQDAAVQLNRNKFRHLLMSPAVPSSFQPPAGSEPPTRPPLDHDYCSPTKQQLPDNADKVNSQPYTRKLRARPNKQSLLKPELLINKQSENTIKTKKKKFTEDGIQVTNTLLCNSDNEKTTILSVNTNHRKKSISSSSSICSNPSDLDYLSSISRNNNIQEATKVKVDQDKDIKTGCGTIKLTIKNKSKVILKIDSETSNELSQNNVRDESVKKSCSSVEVKTSNDKKKQCAKENGDMNSGKVVKVKSHDRSLLKAIQKDDQIVNSTSTVNQTLGPVKNVKVTIASKTPMKNEHSIQQKPQTECKENVHTFTLALQETDKLELKKKKLNLQEYKKRREGVSVKSSNNSRTHSPNSLSGTSPSTANDNTKPGNPDDTKSYQSMVSQMLQNVLVDRTKDCKDVISSEDSKPIKKVFDPITEASKKILLKQQQKAALRKNEDEIVMSKIPKVESLELKPLLTDVEVMKYTGVIPPDLAMDIDVKKSPDRLKNNEYQEIVLVSVGVNTDPIVTDKIVEVNENIISKHKEKLPSTDSVNNKQLINFKIKKPDSLIKNNVFKEVIKKGNSEIVKDNKDCRRSNSANGFDRKSSASNCSEKSNKRLDEDTYKTITATLKTVSDVKVSSYSLLASIQDVVMKKAPESETQAVKKDIDRRSRERSHSVKNLPMKKHNSPVKVSTPSVNAKVVIVNENKDGTEHGEDKVILHLRKDRIKPEVSTIDIQTDADETFGCLILETMWIGTTENVIEDSVDPVKETKSSSVKRSRKRNDSDMSMSSESSDTRGIGEICDRSGQTGVEKRLDDNFTSKVAISNNVNKRFSVEPNVKEIRPKMQSLPAARSRSKPRSKRSRSRSRSRFRSRSRDRYNSRCSSNRYKNNYRPRSRSPRRRNGRPHSKSPYRGRRYNHRDRRSPSYDKYRKSGDHGRSRSRHRSKSRTRNSRYQTRRSVTRDRQRDIKAKRLSRSPSNKPQKVIERISECTENVPSKVAPPIVEAKKVETVVSPVESTVPVLEEVVSSVVDVPQRTFTPPPRKQTTSECSDSSTSSSSSSSSNSSSSTSSSSSSSFASSGGSRSSASRSRSRSPHGAVSAKDRLEGSHYKGGRTDRRSGPGYGVNSKASNINKSSSDEGECKTPVEERRIVFVGKLDKNITKVELRRLFLRFGRIVDVTLHTKDNGARYGFVTYARAADAWTAVDSAPRIPGLARLDVGFGGRRAFCRQRYADLDGLEAEYSEGLYMNQSVAPKPLHQNQDLSFDLLLQQMKVKLGQKKVESSKKGSEKDSTNSCNESV